MLLNGTHPTNSGSPLFSWTWRSGTRTLGALDKSVRGSVNSGQALSMGLELLAGIPGCVITFTRTPAPVRSAVSGFEAGHNIRGRPKGTNCMNWNIMPPSGILVPNITTFCCLSKQGREQPVGVCQGDSAKGNGGGATTIPTTTNISTLTESRTAY